MALIQMSIVSRALFRTVPVTVILPADKRAPDGTLLPERPLKTLYLLHGLLGSHNDWINHTRVQRWAEARDLAVVMPSGDNSFYVDRPDSRNCYAEFIGNELVEVTRRMFPLSRRREDTYIGGLSMGGFGALHCGLKYHENFSRIIPLSAAVHIFDFEIGAGIAGPEYYESLFGPLDTARNTERNPRVQIAQLAQEKKQNPALQLPVIRMACGESDGLLRASRLYRDLLTDAGFEVDYEEAPGGHDWDFWDTQIKKTIDWLPLDAQAEGLSSGSVDTNKE